jgi:hypothetical protein
MSGVCRVCFVLAIIALLDSGWASLGRFGKQHTIDGPFSPAKMLALWKRALGIARGASFTANPHARQPLQS